MADLKEILGEELYNQVKAKAGDNKIAIVSDGSYIPVDKFNSLNDTKKGLADQVKNLTGQIDGLKTTVDEYEKLKPQLEAMKTAAGENPLLKKQLEDLQEQLGAYPKQIEDLQNENKGWSEKYKDTQITSAIKLGLLGAKVKPGYEDLLLPKFDKTKIELGEDGTVKGFDDQLKLVQEGFKDLFVEAVPGTPGANPAGGGNEPPKDESKMTDAEWFAAHTASK